jgi:hypothetical protein
MATVLFNSPPSVQWDVLYVTPKALSETLPIGFCGFEKDCNCLLLLLLYGSLAKPESLLLLFMGFAELNWHSQFSPAQLRKAQILA